MMHYYTAAKAAAALLLGCLLLRPSEAALVGHWTFLDGTDETGNFAPGILSGGASFSGGQLSVSAAGGQYYRTGAYSGPALNAKTLVAWVYVTDLNARGGSVLTLENAAGADIFDGIVFAERVPLKWMAGSNNWLRTQDVSGVNESAGPDTLVQVAIVYGDPVAANNQNRITLYRNGASYGTYILGTRVTYSAGPDTNVIFGKRHDDTSGTAFFTGRIEEARIYDTALTQAEITALTLTAGNPPVISQQPQNTSAVEGGTPSFSIALQSPGGASYQWRRNTQPIPSATTATYSPGIVGLQDNGATFDCIVTNPFGSKTSDPAILTVTADVTPPAITAAISPGDPSVIVLTFSEPINPTTAATAAHYTIPGHTVLSARMGQDNRTVILRVSGLTTGNTYNVQVTNIQDTASSPNTIAPGTQQSLSLTWTSLSTRFYRNNPETPAPSSRNTGLIFTEIMYEPAPRTDGRNLRFIELLNTNPWAQDLTGCRVSGDVNFNFAPGTSLAAGAYLVIAAVPADITAIYGLANVLGPWTGDLSAPDLNLRLRNRNDAILLDIPGTTDSPWPAAPNGFGPSLILARPSLGEANPEAWAASRQSGGSPGAAEPPLNYDFLDAVMINEAGVSPGFIELFNLSSIPVDVSGCQLLDGTHSFTIPAGITIPATGTVSFPEAALAFAPDSTGGVLILRSPGGTRVLHELRSTGIPAGLSFGSTRDGAPLPFLLTSPTPGAPNTGRRQPAVVLNEIQYNPASGLNTEEFIELKNVSANPVDLSGWRLRGEADFDIPPGTVLNAGAYLVIADNRTQLLASHPNLSPSLTIGDFTGDLSNSGGRLSLRSPMPGGGFATEDEVTYGTGGRWGAWADGDGSTLERVDHRVDARRATAWADSDESSKSAWTTVQVTGVLDHGRDAATAFEILLDDAGECLVDDVEVTVSGGPNRVPNATFDAGLTGWVFQGTHEGATHAPGLGTNNSGALRLQTAGSGDPSNRAFILLSTTPASGQTATLRAKVRWLRGTTGLRLRLRGNWLEAAAPILTTADLGTPGAPNSRALPNAGPALFDLKHWPVLPAANESVTVTVRAEDPDALASLNLNYRLDPSPAVITVPMTYRHTGLFSATIPGQATGTLAAFYIEAGDPAATAGVNRFPSDAPAREALVRWGDTNVSGPLPTLNMWMTKATFDRWSSRSKMSNAPLDITIAQRNDRVIYNAGGQFAGSPFHTLGFNGSPGVYDTPTGHWCDYDIYFPKDDLFLGAADTKLSWPGNVGEDTTALREHVAGWTGEQMGLAISPRRYLHLFVNGVRRAGVFEEAVQVGDEMIRSYFPGQDDGTLHKLQLWFEFNDDVSSFTHSDARLGNWLTTGGVRKTARYRANWPRRSAGNGRNDFTDLFALMDTATTTATGDAYTAAIGQLIDVEQWMRVVAFEHVIQNVDSFGNSSYAQNMYAYKPPGGRWVLVPWDNDFAYAGDTNGGLFAINDSQVLKMANHPPFRRHLWRAYYDAAHGPLLAANFNAFVDKLSAGLTSSSATVTSAAGVKSNAAARRTYILNQLATVATTFTANCPATSADVTINVTGTAPVETASIEINGLPLTPRWTSLTAWTAPFILHSGANTLTVIARNTAGTAIATVTLNCTFTGTMQWPALRINEWMAANSGFIRDTADNDADDWFELYNPTAAAVNLSGWSLVDAAQGATPFIIPAGYSIPAGGRLLVWADNETTQNTGNGQLHVDFKLDASAESITLLAPDGSTVDTVTFGQQITNLSSGRTPDGSATLAALTSPTPGTANTSAAPAPNVSAITRTGTQFTVTFTTIPGFTYQMQTSSDLAAWSPAGSPVTATGPETSLTGDTGDTARKYFRILRTP